MFPFLRRVFRTHHIVKLTILLAIICYYFGLFTLTLEEDFEGIDRYFVPNISKYIKQLQNNRTPDIPPTNNYNYRFINVDNKKCDLHQDEYPLRLVYIIKSACENFERREGIRKSWGFEKRFSDVSIRTVFILGLPTDGDIQSKIDQESNLKKDIVQANFVDSYYNNTIKTLMGIKWAVTQCRYSKFYFFSDDDMYVSTKNVLKFIRNPLDYPYYLQIPFMNINPKSKSSENPRKIGQLYDIELPEDAELYAGYMFHNSRPQRHFSSKWYVSLNEYPFSRYPPYVTAGAYVVSKAALQKLYYASFFVKHFKLDDIYMALLAKGSNIIPVHNDEFYFYKKPYSEFDYKYVIASHGYGDPEELQNVWHKEKTLGHA